MRLDPDQLRDKALLALEDAAQECRYRTPRRSFLLRFALAYLWSVSLGDRGPFDNFWTAMGQPHSPWSHGAADMALSGVYRALGIERPDAVSWAMWRK
ncbi:MAG: hypothetical protein M3448_08505, partial [Pseudomonadota bacterium]|nr:hypothetical protein [Pseudomonadota bacterium]